MRIERKAQMIWFMDQEMRKMAENYVYPAKMTYEDSLYRIEFLDFPDMIIVEEETIEEPAEETVGGATLLIKDGCMDNPNVEQNDILGEENKQSINADPENSVYGASPVHRGMIRCIKCLLYFAKP